MDNEQHGTIMPESNEPTGSDDPAPSPSERPYMKRLKELADPRTFNISIDDKEVILGAFLRIEWLEKENQRLTDAIREKDRRLERLADEADAWERTARDI